MTTKEHPILFSADMVRAILDGRKTQTRLPLKTQPETYMGETGLQFELPGWHGSLGVEKFVEHSSPFGGPGDTLWVRETWQPCNDGDNPGQIIAAYRSDWEANGSPEGPLGGKWRPNIHMPRWASRITLKVTKVRVERIQDISERDAIAEGIHGPNRFGAWRDYAKVPTVDRRFRATPIESFASLWDSIYAKKGFGRDVNPWVWAVEFEYPAEMEADRS